MFGHSKVLLVELFKDSWLLFWTRSLAGGLKCNTGLMVPCCVLLFSSLKEYAGPELKETALKENSFSLQKVTSLGLPLIVSSMHISPFIFVHFSIRALSYLTQFMGLNFILIIPHLIGMRRSEIKILEHQLQKFGRFSCL